MVVSASNCAEEYPVVVLVVDAKVAVDVGVQLLPGRCLIRFMPLAMTIPEQRIVPDRKTRPGLLAESNKGTRIYVGCPFDLGRIS